MITATAERLAPGDPAYRGQAEYTPAFLAVYDSLVLGFANRFVWRCPSSAVLRLYDEHVSVFYFDVGPGTGWLVERCRFPALRPALTLLDANPDVLAAASRRLARHEPRVHQADLLKPLGLPKAAFDSVALTHVLHCLPGTMADKTAVLDRLAELLRPGGRLFGSTVLSGGVPHTPLSRALERFLNHKGVFGNRGDDLATLEQALAERFAHHEIRTRGSVALFVARI